MALHVLIITAFVLAMQNAPAVVRGVHEITLMLFPTVPMPRAVNQVKSKPRSTAAQSVLPELVRPEHPVVTPRANSLQSLHGLLFDCGPDQILTPEDRTRCQVIAGAPTPDDTAQLRNPHERAKDAAHWARALARKQAPTLLPCASPQGINPVYTAFCLAKAALDGGFDLNAQPSYADVQKSWHLPNNGDPIEPRKTIGE